MSLLGIDVGTTGCKAAAFSERGRQLAIAYDEYDIRRPRPGGAELDSEEVWQKVKRVIREAVGGAGADKPTALAVSSMGEALVPVTSDRRIVGPSILNFDCRGEEYVPALREALPADLLYAINGNAVGNHFSLTKMLWIRDHQPALHEKADLLLPWASLISFMLGADPVVDFCLANRTLLFDVDRGEWSSEICRRAGISSEKLPKPAPSAKRIGQVSAEMASELGLPHGVSIVSGAHDQCANAVGCGAVDAGSAMCGMGTYICVVPVFSRRPEPGAMARTGLNTEHHAVPSRFVSFLYNQGGSLLKWYRDTFAARDKEAAASAGKDIYEILIGECPTGPSGVLVLPHFAPTGPREFISDSSGVITGLRLETTRGDILKGIMEGAIFYIRELLDSLGEAGVSIRDLRAVGGGSKSDLWLQVCADIFGKPLVRSKVVEAGCLGAAIIAGVGTGAFQGFPEGVDVMVETGQGFEPSPAGRSAYDEKFQRYREMWPLMRDFLTRRGRRSE